MRARVVAGLVATLLLACADERPDVVLIVVDTLRADHLGAYGYPRETSPSLDRFAREAVVFENATAPASWTLPSVGSIMTGTYPTAHGLRARDGARRYLSLREGATTLATVLRDAGWETVAGVTNPWVASPLHGLAAGVERFEDLGPANAEAVNAFARDAFARRRESAPLFLYLHYMDVHGPYNATGRAVDLGAPVRARPADRDALARVPTYLARADATGADAYVEAYDQGIRAWDDAFGALVDWLRETGRLDDAILVVASDHGEEFLEHGGWDHGATVYQEQIAVPLLLRIPGRTPSRRRDAAVSLVDVAPTLLAAVGLEAPETMWGDDLLAGPLDPERWVFSETQVAEAGVARARQRRAARTGPTKIVAGPYSRQCFDLARDPAEERPIPIGEGCDPALLERLDAWRDEMRAIAEGLGPQRQGAPTPAERRRLRALGYAD